MPIDKVEKELRDSLEQRRMLKRIEANTIIAETGFRDHFCTHPGRHSWDLCGHPMYYWTFKTILGSKYIQKCFVHTEVEEALEMAKNMSDKFIPVKRPLDDCKEPATEIIDDLKTPDSRRWRYPNIRGEILVRAKEKEILGDIKPVIISCPVCYPLVTTESLDRLIEAYFSDPFADKAYLFYKCCPSSHMIDPTTGYFIVIAAFHGNFGRRQQSFQMYHSAGYHIPTAETEIWAQGRVTGVEVPVDEGIDIGDEEDLRIARIFMEARLKES